VCHNGVQVKLRLPYRLLAALMLLPAAFGIGGTLIATPRTPQSIVCPYRKERRAPKPADERLAPAIPARAARSFAAQRDPGFSVLWLHYGLFQRPPPAVLLFA